MQMDSVRYSWELDFHGYVFHSRDCLADASPVLALIEQARSIFSIGLDDDLVANQIGKFRPRELKPTAKNWNKVVGAINEGKISNLLSGGKHADGYLQLGIAFTLDNSRKRQDPDRSLYAHDKAHFWVSYALIEDGTVTLEQCCSYLRQAWLLLQGDYGFADLFISHRTGLVSPAHVIETERQMRAKQWTSLVVSSLEDARTQVRGAFWLNYLNAQHVSLLGGLDRVMSRVEASLPNGATEAIDGGGLCVTISQSPKYESTEAYVSDRAVLLTIIAPIMEMMPRNYGKGW